MKKEFLSRGAQPKANMTAPHPRILFISTVFSILMLAFIEIIATVPLTIFLLTDITELQLQWEREPFMIIAMVVGGVIGLAAIILNVLLLADYRVKKPLAIIYSLMIVLLWTAIIALSRSGEVLEALALNVFFLPFYIQLIVMYIDQGQTKTSYQIQQFVVT
ncbi:MAG: hypothetical protein ACXAE3_08285 [Candidatus Kariarchaeaceae archaeon]|jgi:hypothetical protein